MKSMNAVFVALLSVFTINASAVENIQAQQVTEIKTLATFLSQDYQDIADMELLRSSQAFLILEDRFAKYLDILDSVSGEFDLDVESSLRVCGVSAMSAASKAAQRALQRELKPLMTPAEYFEVEEYLNGSAWVSKVISKQICGA